MVDLRDHFLTCKKNRRIFTTIRSNRNFFEIMEFAVSCSKQHGRTNAYTTGTLRGLVCLRRNVFGPVPTATTSLRVSQNLLQRPMFGVGGCWVRQRHVACKCHWHPPVVRLYSRAGSRAHSPPNKLQKRVCLSRSTKTFPCVCIGSATFQQSTNSQFVDFGRNPGKISDLAESL